MMEMVTTSWLLLRSLLFLLTTNSLAAFPLKQNSVKSFIMDPCFATQEQPEDKMMTGASPSSDAGDVAAAIDYARLVGRLKDTPRTGWVRAGVPHYESVADHSWRMAAMVWLLLADERDCRLDVARCLGLAILHDMPEALTGDFCPADQISSQEKQHLETNAIHTIATTLEKATGPYVATQLLNLWHEYENRQTAEAQAVKDLDLLDMLIQADEYEEQYSAMALDLSDFFDSTSVERFTTPRIRAIAKAVHERRQARRLQGANAASSNNDNTAAVISAPINANKLLSPQDQIWVDNYAKASTVDATEIAKIVRALRANDSVREEKQSR
jgi:putative hydrolase of HD superfamily